MSDTPKPTIDERIAAIAESVRMSKIESRDSFAKLDAAMQRLAEAQARLERIIP